MRHTARSIAIARPPSEIQPKAVLNVIGAIVALMLLWAGLAV
jgi:hypothetical protein